eukprot:15366510-Ditylum_brightwellii.AAC.1
MYVQTTKELAQYASRTCKQPEDIKKATEKLEETNIPMPALSTIHAAIKDPEGNAENTIANIYLNKQIDLYLKRKETYQENKTVIFSVIIGQCNELMIAKLESETAWKGIKDAYDVVGLLLMIKDILYKYKT